MKGPFGELQCLHTSLQLACSSDPARAKYLLTLGLRICEQEELDPVVPKAELFMLTSKMLLNKQMARERRVIAFSAAFLSYLLVERG